jgi:hypothetical protein
MERPVNDKIDDTPRPARNRRRGLLITLAVVAVAGATLWSQLPRSGYPTDLSRIGQGRPALVLAYDHFYVGGGEVMGHMDAIRSDYAQRVEFLVADMSTTPGRGFAARHDAGDGTVLLFDARGAHLATLHQPQGTAELRQALETALLEAP